MNQPRNKLDIFIVFFAIGIYLGCFSLYLLQEKTRMELKAKLENIDSDLGYIKVSQMVENLNVKHGAVAAPTLAINCWDRVVSYPMRTPKKSCEIHSNEKCSYWSPPAWGYEVGQTAMQCGKTPADNCPDFPVEAECCVYAKNVNFVYGFKPPCIGTFPLPRP